MRYYKLLLPALLAGFVAACGGGGGGDTTTTTATETTTAVALSGKVYDQELSGAEVEVLVGNTVVATATTDSNGAYSVNLSVTETARTQRCVVRAVRGNFSLRSLLGNVGSITDTATSNGGSISSDSFPAANVTNVSTAVAAVIEAANSNTLPSSQAEIDAAIDVIQASTALQQNVVEVAAAIKAVVDYGADVSAVGGATNTDELAKAIIATGDTATALNAVAVTGSETNVTVLQDEVTNDPVLAAQLPSDEVTLAADILTTGYVYFLLDPYASASTGIIEGSVFKVTGPGTGSIWSTTDMGSPATVTFTDNTDGTISMTIGTDTLVITVLGGNENSAFVQVATNGVDEGQRNIRRIIPVSANANSVNNINVTSAITNKVFIDFNNSRAVSVGTDCSGTTSDTGAFMQYAGPAASATCTAHDSGMIKMTPNSNLLTSVPTFYVGLMSDSWDGTNVSQAMNIALIQGEITSPATEASIAAYGRVYTPLPVDTSAGNGPLNNKQQMRIDSQGNLSLRFVTEATSPTQLHIYKAGTTTTAVSLLEKTLEVAATSAIYPVSYNYSYAATTLHRYSVNLGKHSGGKLNAVFAPQNSDQAATIGTGTNPVQNVNTRLLYSLDALTASDIFNGTTDTAATFSMRHLVRTDALTVTFNRADGTATSGTGTTQNTDGTPNSTFTWSEAQAPSGATAGSVDFTGTSYLPTLLVTQDSEGDRIHVYIDKSTGISTSFVVGQFIKDTSNALIDVDGWALIRN